MSESENKMKPEKNVLPSIEHLLFRAPLYAEFDLPDGKLGKDDNFLTFCPFCKDDTVFKREGARFGAHVRRPIYTEVFQEVVFKCAKNENHRIRFQIRFDMEKVQKWGQFPPFSVGEQLELKSLRKMLPSEKDGRELHRAIRLAGEGVGIGSFVYIRRILERVIFNRFLELKEERGWSEQDFSRMRMPDRIDFLRADLPTYLVETRGLWTILNEGVHEHEEEECLKFFDVAYVAIKEILRDAQQKRDEEMARRDARSAIGQYVAINKRGA
jgi:hypothetical protein